MVEIIVSAFGIYLAIGILFAVWFVIFGITKLDDSAKETSIFFRLIIFFGTMTLWFFLLKQILQDKEKIEVTAHRL